jgi:hypothetical protein
LDAAVMLKANVENLPIEQRSDCLDVVTVDMVRGFLTRAT